MEAAQQQIALIQQQVDQQQQQIAAILTKLVLVGIGYDRVGTILCCASGQNEQHDIVDHEVVSHEVVQPTRS